MTQQSMTQATLRTCLPVPYMPTREQAKLATFRCLAGWAAQRHWLAALEEEAQWDLLHPLNCFDPEGFDPYYDQPGWITWRNWWRHGALVGTANPLRVARDLPDVDLPFSVAQLVSAARMAYAEAQGVMDRWRMLGWIEDAGDGCWRKTEYFSEFWYHGSTWPPPPLLERLMQREEEARWRLENPPPPFPDFEAQEENWDRWQQQRWHWEERAEQWRAAMRREVCVRASEF